MRRIFRIAIILALLAVMAGGTAAWRLSQNRGSDTAFRTVPLKRTDLVATISASGTVEPEEVVDVGAQVAGQISSFGKDKNGKTIDYGSAVEEGTVLAKIDDSLYAADVGLAKAQLAQAKAGQSRAEADLLQMKAKLDQAQRDWERAQKLGPSEALAPTTYDAYKATYETAKSNVGVDEAAVEQAKAAVGMAQATLDRTQRNLGYTTITSPVKGVIIDRRVNIGQTVVSSLNAPSLFLIAKDLTRIQVWVPVNEADIGNIHPGLPVSFTVAAFPGQVFHGQVGKVRLNATMTQNIVTYTVEVTTDNADGKLLPYLTADAKFETGRRQNVLAVPDAALQWEPQPNQIAPEFRQIATTPADPAARPSKSAKASDGAAKTQGTIWVQQGEFVRPLKVSVGLSDGSLTEVQAPELADGMRVVVSDQSAEMASGGQATGASPFTPQMGRSRPANQGQGGQGGPPAGGGSRPGGGRGGGF